MELLLLFVLLFVLMAVLLHNNCIGKVAARDRDNSVDLCYNRADIHVHTRIVVMLDFSSVLLG